MHIDTRHGRFSAGFWRAHEGPALGAEKAVFGRAWFYFLPRPGYRHWVLHSGSMRVIDVKWLSWCVELVHMVESKHEGNVTPILGKN